MPAMNSLIAELDQFLERSPSHSYMGRPGPPPAPPAPYVPTHSAYQAPSLNNAERGVDRLGRAIQAAEEEMESALWRTQEVHKTQLRQKEVELTELQRLLATKERNIDNLRDTLATTKRTFEARVAQVESTLSMKDQEVVALSEELRATQMEREALVAQLQKHTQMTGREMSEMREREAALMNEARAKAEEAMRSTAALRAERQDCVRHQTELSEARRQLELMGDELRVMRVESRAERERLEGQVEVLKHRLRTERSVRKACEKWLRSELKSREEMDVLLSAIRDAAGTGESLPMGVNVGLLGGRERSPDHADDELLLLDALKLAEGVGARKGAGSPGRRGGFLGGVPGAGVAGALRSGAAHQSVLELEAQSQKVLEENRRLQSELLSARKLLTEKLMR